MSLDFYCHARCDGCRQEMHDGDYVYCTSCIDERGAGSAAKSIRLVANQNRHDIGRELYDWLIAVAEAVDDGTHRLPA